MEKMTRFKGQYWREEEGQSVMDSLSLREGEGEKEREKERLREEAKELEGLKKVVVKTINT